MRRTLSSLVGILLLAPGVAAAGPFGGFSRDGSHYLADTTRCASGGRAPGMPAAEKKTREVAGSRSAMARSARGRAACSAGVRTSCGARDCAAVRAEWDASTESAASARSK